MTISERARPWPTPGPVMGWIAISLAAGALGAIASRPDAWYLALDKPEWTPPSWVFGPVWTTLYVMMGAAAGIAWRAREPDGPSLGFWLFGLQLALNSFWSWLFFRWQRPDLALLDLILLLGTILATLLAFRRIRPLAGWLLVPYLCWVTFAGALNASIAARNPGGVPPVRGGEPQLGIAVDDCAPWDGAATSIYLSPVGPVRDLPPPGPYLHLIVYRPGVRLPGTLVDIGARDGNMGAGIAVRCEAGGECASTEHGLIGFGQPGDEEELTGWYRLKFGEDSAAGSFSAAHLSRPAICG